MTRYAELDVTTNFTFLRGGSHPEELVATAKALGLDAIAVTDSNTLAGIVRGHLAAKEVGIKFIVGARLDLLDAPSLLAYPRDRAAYGRLCRLLTLGQRRTEKGQCTLYLDDVAALAEGLIFIALPPEDFPPHLHGHRPALTAAIAVTTDHLDSEESAGYWIPAVQEGDARRQFRSGTQAHQAVARCRAPLYLAARHSYRGDDRARISALADLAARVGIPLVATGGVLYHAPHRRPLQDVLTCIREKCTVNDAGLRLEANAERHIKRRKEMARLFTGHEDALRRSVEIADACTFSLDELKYEYPDEPVPHGKTPQSHLEDLTWEGAAWRFPEGIPEKVRDTLRKELVLIAELNYAPYFLTVHDIVHYARSQSILCQGRGSAANSAVCYCLAITNVDPTEIDLLFERFVSPERKEPPDIDVDFEHERREEVIQYIYARYGRDRAGLAATVICYRGRLAVREVGKALGLSEDTVAALATTIWGLSNSGLPDEYVRQAGLDPRDPLLARVLELTQELIGFPRHLSQHVGGFVLTRGPLSEVVPIGNAAMEDRTVIEWDKDDLDALGLLKVDVLGLGMLTCIRKAFALLKAHYGKEISLGTVPRDDPAVYDMLCRANSIGVFQVESRAQMNMLPRLKPRYLLRSRHRGRHRAPRPHPGRHGAPIFAPPLRRRAGRVPFAASRIMAPPTNSARCSARPWACRCSRSRPCGLPWWRRNSPGPRRTSCAAPWRPSAAAAPSTRLHREDGRPHDGARLSGRVRRALLQPDQGLRRIWLPREPCRELRPSGLCLGLDQMPLPGGVCRFAAQFAADGLLRAGADRALRARAWRRGARGRRQSQSWDCTLEPVDGVGAASSIPPLEGEGGSARRPTPGGVNTRASKRIPPPGVAKARRPPHEGEV